MAFLRPQWHVVGMREAFSARFNSSAKAAEYLFPKWKKHARAEVERTNASQEGLANKIRSLLRDGDPTGWWQARPKLRGMFADSIGLEQAVVFTAQSAARTQLGFPEFPALTPLSSEEVPCRLGTAPSVFGVAIDLLAQGDVQHAWVTAPPGAGKTLAVRLVHERLAASVRAFSALTLRDAVASAAAESSRVLLVEIDEQHVLHDREALAALRGYQRSIVILSPFSCPERAARSPHWRTVEASPSGPWIETLVHWVHERLERSERDTKLDPSAVLMWIEQNDPRERLFRSPGDVLALCADFDMFGDDAPLVERSSRWLDGVGIGCMSDDAPATWKKHCATDALRAMIVSDLRDTQVRHGSRAKDHWAALVPERISPVASGEIPGAEMACAYMRNAGLLRGGPAGLVPFPHWVAEGTARAETERLIANKDTRPWGEIAADDSRAPMIDDALDALPDRSLRATISRVATQLPPRSLAAVAVLEGIVGAAGRRATAIDWTPGERVDLQKLLLAQLDHLVTEVHHQARPFPFTRRDPDATRHPHGATDRQDHEAGWETSDDRSR